MQDRRKQAEVVDRDTVTKEESRNEIEPSTVSKGDRKCMVVSARGLRGY